MKNIYLLNEEEAKLATRLYNDRSLSHLSFWEEGTYRALTNDGDDLGFIHCSARIAGAVNDLINYRERVEAEGGRATLN